MGWRRFFIGKTLFLGGFFNIKEDFWREAFSNQIVLEAICSHLFHFSALLVRANLTGGARRYEAADREYPPGRGRWRRYLHGDLRHEAARAARLAARHGIQAERDGETVINVPPNSSHHAHFSPYSTPHSSHISADAFFPRDELAKLLSGGDDGGDDAAL